MTETPKKLVHWENNSPSFSNLNSPFFNATYESSIDSTSSLEFINSQLVAHGFVPSPGLSLAGISNEESARVVKCLLGMLGQRVDDMSRTEELTTKLRTLSYDHERMLSMYRTATDKCANAEREMNLHKSRLVAALKTLQTSENAHKQTTAELQRTRTLLQGVRATHQAELKKKEKDIERTLEKWQKLADAQSKVSAASSGLRCANVAVVEGTEILGKGQGFLEIALEQAEQARSHLGDENLLLRKLVLRAVNEMQSILHKARCLLPGNLTADEPVPLTLSTLFPLSPPSAASDKLDAIFNDFRETLSTLSQPTSVTAPTLKPAPQVLDADVERLQGIIINLKEELARSQKQSMAHVAETQAMFDKFAEDHRIATGEIGEMSVELISAPLRDEGQERLDKLRKELDMDRRKFTDATIRFGKEKADLEAERLKFLDEKRSWQVEMMLADLPPTPGPASPNKSPTAAFVLSARISPHKAPHKSPRKSPAKNICVGKAGSGRKAHRVSRRSLASPNRMVLSYETELIPPIPAPSFPSMASLAPPTSSLLPTSFVLPPPSPRASLPTKPVLLPPLPDLPTTSENQEAVPVSSSELSPPSSGSNLVIPSTPLATRRPFPVAKPFAPRMIHAYSPVKPSPLSRILMLADSPVTPTNLLGSDISLSPTSGPLESVAEEPDDGGLGYITGALNDAVHLPQEPEMSLAAELGVESPPDTPLQEKKVEPNVAPPRPIFGRGRVFHLEPNSKKPRSSADKGKAKAEPAPRARTSALGEKENSNTKKAPSGKAGRVSPALPGGNAAAPRKVSPTGNAGKPAPKVLPNAAPASSLAVGTSRTKPPAKPPLPPIAGGGPRRVLINSADAPPIGKGWKG
ncbi:Afadin and alpha-actinin-binding-domain-containing protein [Flammula alnicola]|nr:Afadin and alpha-actinin-binding-domain-containing protein [Flammula alnicola]